MSKFSPKFLKSLLAMRKDQNLLASELTVQVTAHGNHFHFKTSSPFVDQHSFDEVDQLLMLGAIGKEIKCVAGDYTFRQTLVDGTKCTNTDTPDATTVEFLLQSIMTRILNDIIVHLRAAFAEWPKDTASKTSLEATYSEMMRVKCVQGSDATPIDVRVTAPKGGLLEDLNDAFQEMFTGSPKPTCDVITLAAFSRGNICANAVRAAFAEYAKTMLYAEVIPQILPLVKSRLLRMIETQEAHLVEYQQAATTTDPTQTEVVGEESLTPRAPAATSGVVGDASPDATTPSNGTTGQSTGAPA